MSWLAIVWLDADPPNRIVYNSIGKYGTNREGALCQFEGARDSPTERLANEKKMVWNVEKDNQIY